MVVILVVTIASIGKDANLIIVEIAVVAHDGNNGQLDVSI